MAWFQIIIQCDLNLIYLIAPSHNMYKSQDKLKLKHQHSFLHLHIVLAALLDEVTTFFKPKPQRLCHLIVYMVPPEIYQTYKLNSNFLHSTNNNIPHIKVSLLTFTGHCLTPHIQSDSTSRLNTDSTNLANIYHTTQVLNKLMVI